MIWLYNDALLTQSYGFIRNGLIPCELPLESMIWNLANIIFMIPFSSAFFWLYQQVPVAGMQMTVYYPLIPDW